MSWAGPVGKACSLLCLSACSLASVRSKGAKKKRKRDEGNSDEAEDFSESDSELGEPFFAHTHRHCACVVHVLVELVACLLTVCMGSVLNILCLMINSDSACEAAMMHSRELVFL